jgi:hypothetical protein
MHGVDKRLEQSFRGGLERSSSWQLGVVVGLKGGDSPMSNELIRKQILAALSHPEAEDGLYFNNLIVVHEEEERPIVEGDEGVIRATLAEMVKDGLIRSTGEGTQEIFSLADT